VPAQPPRNSIPFQLDFPLVRAGSNRANPWSDAQVRTQIWQPVRKCNSLPHTVREFGLRQLPMTSCGNLLASPYFFAVKSVGMNHLRARILPSPVFIDHVPLAQLLGEGCAPGRYALGHLRFCSGTKRHPKRRAEGEPAGLFTPPTCRLFPDQTGVLTPVFGKGS